MKVAIIGGGAAGFFAAIRHKELYPDHEVIIFEKTSKVLGKVKISGGGRCNVTHACFAPKELIQYYPRGGKELLGPFHKFAPGDTIDWFLQRGVELKTESDGRMFPVSNISQTIMDCLMNAVNALNISILFHHELKELLIQNDQFDLGFENKNNVIVDRMIIASGSGDKIWQLLSKSGHTIVPPVPSLFTFNILDDRLREYPGISWPSVNIKIEDSKYESTGALLITHWGLSGPAILKLSSFAARVLHQMNYEFKIKINFAYPYHKDDVVALLKEYRAAHLNKAIINTPLYGFTARLWQGWCDSIFDLKNKRWQELSSKEIIAMATLLTQASFQVKGKSTFKEEFVTAGGVDLKDVDMKTMESKKVKNLFFAGEVLNIDALTGGFNFQAAWTTGWIAGSSK